MSKIPPALAALPFPVIGSPLFIISNPKLVIAQCINGVVGSMPALNARPASQLDEWLAEITEALAGNDVVRLKGGDPFIFGRGGEEAEALAEAGIGFEVVPGVTAGLAAAAATLTPLTQRGVASAVVFLTGHEDPTKTEGAIRWEDFGRLGATLCVYMGMKNLETILRRLQAGGLSGDTPAAVIQNATTPRQTQFVSTAGRLALESERAGFGAPAIVIIGEAVRTPARLASLTAQAVERDLPVLS